MLTALRAASFPRMELNAGIFLRDFDMSEYADATAAKTAIKALITGNSEKLLGATRGGGSFEVQREMRTIEADGMRNKFRGSDTQDSLDGHMTGTLLEVTADNIKMLMGTADVVEGDNAKKTEIRMRNDIDLEKDYMENLVWVGDLKGGGLVAIAFDLAINTNDFSMTWTDKGEGTMPFDIHAVQEDVTNDEYAPFAVYLLDK